MTSLKIFYPIPDVIPSKALSNMAASLCYAFLEEQGCSLYVHFFALKPERWLAQNVIPWQG